MLSRKVSRRNFLKIAALSSAGVVLSACSSGSSVSSGTEATAPAEQAAGGETAATPTVAPTAFIPSTDASTVDLWVQQVSIDVMKGAANVFMQKNPDIKVNFVPMTMTDASNNLLASIAAGAGAPDAAFIDWYSIMKFTLRDGTGLNDLTALMPNKSDWVQWDLDLVTTKSGKMIGLPEDLGIEMMFYRRDVFEAAGLPSDPDSVTKAVATWDDMIETGKKLTKNGERWMINTASEVWEILRQEGEVRYFDDDGQPVVNSDRFVKAAEEAVKIRKAGVDAKLDWWSTDWEVARNKVPGVVALYPCAAWWDQIVQPAAPDTKGLWGVVPLPSKASANAGGSFFVFPEMSKKTDKAFKVTSFIEASDEGLTEYMKSGKFLPGYKKFFSSSIFTTPDPFYKDQVWLKAFADEAENAVPLHLNLNDSVATEVLTESIKNILEKGTDPKTELDAANEEIKKRTAGA
jgi:ABC-type glycerol-3-phosphate transport system substrate-binding protein